MMPAISLEMTLEPWQAINDGVMGGISTGRMIETTRGLSFQGAVSLENNGGFASVRRTIELDLSRTSKLRVRLRGDGRTYQARFRQDSSFDSIAWRAEFGTTGDWQTVELDFTDFAPVFRGRKVPQAGPLVAGKIRQFGFLIGDKKTGPFKLEIKSIEFL